MLKVKNKTIKVSHQLCFLFLIGQLVILAFFWQKLPPQVPLFYSRPWGKKQLVKPIGLFLLPTISLLVTLINVVFTRLIPEEKKLVKQLLVIFAAVFNFLCLITLFKIVTLIT